MGYGVDRNEVLRYLGYAGQAMEPGLLGRIDAIIDRCEQDLSPKSIVGYFGIVVHGADAADPSGGVGCAGGAEEPCSESECAGGAEEPCGETQCADGLAYVDVAGASLRLPGFDIVRHLRGARECALFACTLGARSEQELARLNIANPLDALVYDAACSALIERVADATEARIVAEAAERGLHANWRYGPGYGDLPLSVQPQFLSVLKAFETIGLSVTDTDLLLPTKSITAIVGLFDAPPAAEKPRVCESCNMKDFCTLRAKGRVCHG